MSGNRLRNKLILTTWALAVLCLLFTCLFLLFRMDVFESLAITFGTTCYHFVMRLLVGLLINSIFHNQMNDQRAFFRERKWEKPLYDFLKVKQWKGKLPAFSPESFDPRLHDWKYILMASCQAEMVHLIIIAFSFLPILMGFLFGAWPVFIITSFLAAAFDSIFVVMQRFNRPRIRRMLLKVSGTEYRK